MKLGEHVFETLAKLAVTKVDGPPHRLKTGEIVRSWFIPPFRVFYQREGDVLAVLRVYHHARRPVSEGL